jgi:hypothetical protein
MTSVTTLLVLLALFFLGGEIIHNFALALLIGVVIGTYSSIYVASSMILALGISKQDLLPSIFFLYMYVPLFFLKIYISYNYKMLFLYLLFSF